MKRKRANREQKAKIQLAKKAIQIDDDLMEEYDVMNDEAEEPETSMNYQSVGKSGTDERTEKNVELHHKEAGTTRTGDVMRGKQADLELEKTVNGKMENYPSSLREMIVSIIKEISKEPGGLANLSRGLVDDPVSDGQVAQPHADVDVEENASPLRQDPEFKQQELNDALTVIKRTMKLDAADPFNRPVDPIALEIPDYLDVIKTPMDFGTICNNLENGLKYTNSADVYKDVEYIWHNCKKYNKKGDHILELMKRVKTFFKRYWISAGLQTQQSPPIAESGLQNNMHNEEQSANTVTPVAAPTESRPNKLENYSSDPQSDNGAHLQQNEASSNHLLENQPWPITMQASQQSSPQHDEPNIDSMLTLKKRQGRGPTRCVKLLNTVGRIQVAVNELGQPVGPEASKLTSFLGLTARDGNFAPLIYPSWSKMPEENKENMWQKVLTKFEIDHCSRSWVLMSLGTKWRNFKSLLKATHYDTHDNDEDRLLDRDERVLPDQWSVLVAQWSSEKWQSISAKNKANRARHKFTHTSGKKSFARIREEERAKRPDGQEPSKAELFILTRTRKNGQPVNEATAAVISQLRESATQNEETLINKIEQEDEAYTRIMGQDRKGGLNLYGLNATPSRFVTETPTRAEALKMLSEKNAEVLEMKEKLASVEQTCSQMAAQMSQMVSLMANMKKNESDPNIVDDGLLPVGITYQAEPISMSNHEVPVKQTRGRKKKR